jgi:hypothetical protein
MKYFIVLAFIGVLFGCQREFDPEIAMMDFQNKKDAENYVRFCLEQGMYQAADSLVKDIDKADSEIVNYYHECGRGAYYSGTEFINDGYNHWYIISVSGKSKCNYGNDSSEIQGFNTSGEDSTRGTTTPVHMTLATWQDSSCIDQGTMKDTNINFDSIRNKQ